MLSGPIREALLSMRPSVTFGRLYSCRTSSWIEHAKPSWELHGAGCFRKRHSHSASRARLSRSVRKVLLCISPSMTFERLFCCHRKLLCRTHTCIIHVRWERQGTLLRRL